ncbi:MAG: alkaline phosphatase, partial [Lentisphaeria bacterium]|nr:alkaline phosphatase [Lentisphaeria bacterium]
GLTMGLAGKRLNPLLLSNQKCSADAFKSVLAAKQKAGEVKSFEDAIPLITEKFGLLFQPGKDPKDPMLLSKQEQQELVQAFGKKKLHIALRAVMSKKAGIGWTTTGHTAVPVLTTSVGNGSEKFAGYIENTDIARNIRKFLQEK